MDKMRCLFCTGSHIQKNGLLPSGGQRYKCVDCHRQFSQGGKRDTYTPKFIKQVVDAYCHQSKSVKEMLSKYGISSRTLIKRSYAHKKCCKKCS
ncbi:MAG: hypothetical protein Q8O99_07225 [bacterium]|nr:hypothetical protein [bacterium]